MSAHRRKFSAHTASAVVRELELTADELLAALLRLAPARRLAILDGGTPHSEGRFAHAHHFIAGFDPFEIVEACPRSADASGASDATLSLLDERLRELQQPSSADERFPFVLPGACVATIAYDFVHRIERLHSELPALHATAHTEPDAVFAFYDTLVIHDYACRKTYITSCANEHRVTQVCEELLALVADARQANSYQANTNCVDSPKQSSHTRTLTRAASNFTRDAYLAAVLRVQEHIRAGDIYQANITQQLTCPLAPDDEAADVFLRLRRAHPALFGAFIYRGADTVVSISPERFLRVWHDNDGAHPPRRLIEAAPIKGTRPRGHTALEDARLYHELEVSMKDRAENVMIVDLMRNDLGRIAEYGSIEVAELCRVEQHPTLFHLVSTVRGTLREEVTAGDLLRAAFPCGSITGAPKIRAMEIIGEIEPDPRGLSMGAIGYFSFDGSLDLNVAIRTMTIRDCTARFNVGGGITFDSTPADEYDESLTKARALLAALNAELGSDE